jgi:Raf kinase inhibitor-like YbhB/YbcL family protein
MSQAGRAVATWSTRVLGGRGFRCRALRAALTLWACVFTANAAYAQSFTLTSPDFGPDKPFDARFTFRGLGCNGSNVSPALAWSNPPPGTRGFALMVHDPDAMTGGAGIWHWVIIDIPASARAIAQGAGTDDGLALPAGSRQIRNDYERSGWGGPCPPRGAPPHRYNFTLYALGVEKLDVPPDATASHAGFLINLRSIGKATLSGTYGR